MQLGNSPGFLVLLTWLLGSITLAQTTVTSPSTEAFLARFRADLEPAVHKEIAQGHLPDWPSGW